MHDSKFTVDPASLETLRENLELKPSNRGDLIAVYLASYGEYEFEYTSLILEGSAILGVLRIERRVVAQIILSLDEGTLTEHRLEN